MNQYTTADLRFSYYLVYLDWEVVDIKPGKYRTMVFALPEGVTEAKADEMKRDFGNGKFTVEPSKFLFTQDKLRRMLSSVPRE